MHNVRAYRYSYIIADTTELYLLVSFVCWPCAFIFGPQLKNTLCSTLLQLVAAVYVNLPGSNLLFWGLCLRASCSSPYCSGLPGGVQNHSNPQCFWARKAKVFLRLAPLQNRQFLFRTLGGVTSRRKATCISKTATSVYNNYRSLHVAPTRRTRNANTSIARLGTACKPSPTRNVFFRGGATEEWVAVVEWP